MLEFVFAAGIAALVFAAILSFYIIKKPAGNAKMQEISEAIHKGALTFLKKEFADAYKQKSEYTRRIDDVSFERIFEEGKDVLEF